MKKILVIIIVFCYASAINFIKSQETVLLSGEIIYTPNPCLTEPCLPGLDLGFKTDTATFFLMIDNVMSYDHNSILINKQKYSIGETANLYGQIIVEQDIRGENYYIFNIDKNASAYKNTSEVTTVSDDNIQSDYKVISNSSTGLVQIKGIDNNSSASYNLYNLVGKHLEAGKLNVKSQLNLNKGFYILTISENNMLVRKEKILILE